MYVWNQSGDAFFDCHYVGFFWVDEDSSLMAGSEIIGQYNNRDDAIKELKEIFRQLEVGSFSYNVR